MKKSKIIRLVFLVAALTVMLSAGYLCGCETEGTSERKSESESASADKSPDPAEPAAQQVQLPQQQNEEEEPAVKVAYEVIPYEAMPDNVKMLVDGQKKEAAVVVVDVNHNKYVFIALGARSTGGYSVIIKSVIERQGIVTVVYSEQRPEKGAMVTQAFTYPWIVIKIDTELPIHAIFE